MAKFESRPLSEHEEVPLADDGQGEALTEHWKERREPFPAGTEGSACYVVSVGTTRDPVSSDAQLAEIVALVEHQGGHVVGSECRQLTRANPRTLIGSGTAEELAVRARACGATLLVVDTELSPGQMRNLEDVAGIPICDREAIILNVFLRHAKTRRAKIQVEIAQLEYLRPRIRGVGLDMDQQTGGVGPARGPGETASELLARKLDDRLYELKKLLEKARTSAATQRGQRGRRTSCKKLVLVGYTNAGKTSLMNALTASELSARDMPFETLDTTSRSLSRHGGDVLVSDTVGFIRRFPERLFASFESTLTEITEASLVVVVVDASDPEKELQLRTTLAVLERMGAKDTPRFYVFNKADRVSPPLEGDDVAYLADGHPSATVSTRDPEAMSALLASLLSAARSDEERLTVFVPYDRADVLSLAYARCRVAETVASPRGVTLRLEGPAPALARVTGALKARTA